ncbi:iron dependent repressor, DtxR family [Russula earlei]|uniref:Iron dependent repressor, DtxR family n=1 Tax=Russula earlei TaxID=71964 RepID=A0ACC0TYR4_9AGAM|nr:iron dependent repressor, DtxR family [Russula earlei]
MSTLSATEENYLKAIYTLAHSTEKKTSNQLIADKLGINPASVTDMLKKLDEKKVIDYSRTNGANLTKEGFKLAAKVVRKHRLWETFLVENMNFSWDEVHEVAEQLEHIQSDKLLDELDTLLGYPKFDPHGDPIPDKNGKLPVIKSKPLTEIEAGRKVKLVTVIDNSPAFLRYLDKQGIALNDTILVKEIQDFDKSILVQLKGKKEVYLSAEAAKKILVE